uniref:Uncharacterized protein n=1 Tax=Setaria italica TaxID=4555 RepID=K3YFN2_SETIT
MSKILATKSLSLSVSWSRPWHSPHLSDASSALSLQHPCPGDVLSSVAFVAFHASCSWSFLAGTCLGSMALFASQAA